ncbi:hypothetical protein Y1Q_0006547 [Alligator mississippiensis]|uniref:Uncharacterized protein n=1 Tax=Alligator mississippiensis TaxID=8496 RepID=A0A151MZI7_ALLMI|nr:hypothetical protein Y1Q_0006547 [Alligator mississippiensis]
MSAINPQREMSQIHQNFWELGKDGKGFKLPTQDFSPCFWIYGHKQSPGEMNEQRVTYVDVTFRTPKERNKQKEKPSRISESCSESSSWQLIALVLGSLFLALFVISRVFSAQLRNEIGILPQQEEVLKNLTQLNEILENCILERDNFKAQNTNLKGTE